MEKISKFIDESFKKFNIRDVAISSKFLDANTAFFILNDSAEKYIFEAQEKGCKLIISYKQKKEDITKYLEYGINHVYGQKPNHIVSVTGTNGKTSVVNFYQQIISYCGYKSCSIGTLGVKSNNGEFNKLWSSFSGLTTNNAVTTNKILSSAKSHGIDYVSLEASSHGIVQNRLLGIKFSSIALTNISHDHLDYHGSMEAYKAAKMSLFCDKYMNKNCKIITNLDDASLQKYNPVIIGKNFHYRMINKSLYSAEVEFSYKDKKYNFKTNLIGEFQINNLIISMLMAENSGIDIGNICDAISKINSIKGRMQKIQYKNNFIFIDYAHTPGGLEVVLKELRSLKKDSSKIISVFGCGGDRDKTKRAIMGYVANKYSDAVILTNDNPRSENPKSIIDEIKLGCKNLAKVIEIEDRKEAIIKGISLLSGEDILLIAGKGHEDYQITEDKKVFFSDEHISFSQLMNKLNNQGYCLMSNFRSPIIENIKSDFAATDHAISRKKNGFSFEDFLKKDKGFVKPFVGSKAKPKPEYSSGKNCDVNLEKKNTGYQAEYRKSKQNSDTVSKAQNYSNNTNGQNNKNGSVVEKNNKYGTCNQESRIERAQKDDSKKINESNIGWQSNLSKTNPEDDFVLEASNNSQMQKLSEKDYLLDDYLSDEDEKNDIFSDSDNELYSAGLPIHYVAAQENYSKSDDNNDCDDKINGGIDNERGSERDNKIVSDLKEIEVFNSDNNVSDNNKNDSASNAVLTDSNLHSAKDSVLSLKNNESFTNEDFSAVSKVTMSEAEKGNQKNVKFDDFNDVLSIGGNNLLLSEEAQTKGLDNLQNLEISTLKSDYRYQDSEQDSKNQMSLVTESYNRKSDQSLLDMSSKQMIGKDALENTDSKLLATSSQNDILTQSFAFGESDAGYDGENSEQDNQEDSHTQNKQLDQSIIGYTKEDLRSGLLTITENKEFGAEPKMEIQKIFLNISDIFNKGEKKISVRLYPEHLGKVDIEIKSVNNIITQIKITTHNKDSYDMVSSEIGVLGSSIKELATEGTKLNLELNDNTQQGTDLQNQSNNGESNGNRQHQEFVINDKGEVFSVFEEDGLVKSSLNSSASIEDKSIDIKNELNVIV